MIISVRLPEDLLAHHLVRLNGEEEVKGFGQEIKTISRAPIQGSDRKPEMLPITMRAMGCPNSVARAEHWGASLVAPV